jgi:exodeoxyribonuclease VII large subunit
MKLRALEISEVNSYIKRVLTNDAILYNLKVKGEILNFKVHSSGNVYLSLKDEQSKISCVIFKNYYDKNFEQWGCKLLSEIVIGENFNCFTTDVERLQVILNYYSKFDTKINEKTLLRILSIFVDKKNISIDDLSNLGLYCKKQKNTQQDIEKLHNWLNAN